MNDRPGSVTPGCGTWGSRTSKGMDEGVLSLAMSTLMMSGGGPPTPEGETQLNSSEWLSDVTPTLNWY